MNKFAVVFAAAGLMALAACGEKPAEETANASNAVVENVVENAAVPMENAAENATSNAVENAAE
ncbi:hypothetical protein [Rhizorhapis suberifaciens]|nr:hypothetical protein [Rhizorhapis suberifaciens]